MTGWQEVYKAKFTDKSKRDAEIFRLENETRRADKRTYNGKMTKIFNYASILALKELDGDK